MTKSKMLPCLPEEKSNQACFWSFTKKDGVFSLLNGDRPLNSRPARTSFTRRPTTSDTGRRAFSSSRNWDVKRMGLGDSISPILGVKSSHTGGAEPVPAIPAADTGLGGSFPQGHPVIPGRERKRANPESITRSAAEYGFRVRPFGPSRNDVVEAGLLGWRDLPGRPANCDINNLCPCSRRLGR